MDIGKFEKRMDDALGEVKHLLVQSGYYDNQTLENIDCDRDDPDDVRRWNELTNTSKLLLKAVDDLKLPTPPDCRYEPVVPGHQRQIRGRFQRVHLWLWPRVFTGG